LNPVFESEIARSGGDPKTQILRSGGSEIGDRGDLLVIHINIRVDIYSATQVDHVDMCDWVLERGFFQGLPVLSLLDLRDPNFQIVRSGGFFGGAIC